MNGATAKPMSVPATAIPRTLSGTYQNARFTQLAPKYTAAGTTMPIRFNQPPCWIFFIAAPDVEVADAVVLDRSDCVTFAIEALSEARLLLIEPSRLEIVEERADIEELNTDCEETELELREGWMLVDDATLAVD